MTDQSPEPIDATTLLKEYELLVSLYIHEDNLAFQILQLSIVLNTALLATAGFAPTTAIVDGVIAMVGIIYSIGWQRMTISSTRHHDLRAFRARQIEYELGRKGTFHDEAHIFNYGLYEEIDGQESPHYKQPLLFYDLIEPKKPQKVYPVNVTSRRAFDVTQQLPKVLRVVWSLILIWSIYQTCLQLLR
ncbi:MAG: hypothetical protein JXJ17_12080 [Anaerolineae bacterium]|nr:hypothetical protein [Anaerolineae bacterium]